MIAPADRPVLAGLTAGSLCSGIGALDLAVEACGASICWQAETDPYCTAVLAHHWPHLPNHGDLKELDFCGTGTTVMAARALGRVGIGVDLHLDYCRAARWRSFDPAQAAKTQARTWAEHQGGLFDQRGGGQ